MYIQYRVIHKSVLTAVTMKITVFWDIYQYFRGICCLHLHGRIASSTTKAAGSSEPLTILHLHGNEGTSSSVNNVDRYVIIRNALDTL
jgi:hypothetical protein